MKITTYFGEDYEAEQVKVAMVKTLFVDVYLDQLDNLSGNKVSEEELEEIAHEDWLEAWGAILKMVAEKFPYIDMELFSTDSVKLEIVE